MGHGLRRPDPAFEQLLAQTWTDRFNGPVRHSRELTTCVCARGSDTPKQSQLPRCMLRPRANEFPLGNSARSLSTAIGWTSFMHEGDLLGTFGVDTDADSLLGCILPQQARCGLCEDEYGFATSSVNICS